MTLYSFVLSFLIQIIIKQFVQFHAFRGTKNIHHAVFFISESVTESVQTLVLDTDACKFLFLLIIIVFAIVFLPFFSLDEIIDYTQHLVVKMIDRSHPQFHRIVAGGAIRAWIIKKRYIPRLLSDLLVASGITHKLYDHMEWFWSGCWNQFCQKVSCRIYSSLKYFNETWSFCLKSLVLRG